MRNVEALFIKEKIKKVKAAVSVQEYFSMKVKYYIYAYLRVFDPLFYMAKVEV